MKAWFHAHPSWTVFWGVALLLVYICLLRVWIVHRKDNVGRKIYWTLICFIPLAGFLFYFAFYNAPASHKDGESAPVNNDAVAFNNQH